MFHVSRFQGFWVQALIFVQKAHSCCRIFCDKFFALRPNFPQMGVYSFDNKYFCSILAIFFLTQARCCFNKLRVRRFQIGELSTSKIASKNVGTQFCGPHFRVWFFLVATFLNPSCYEHVFVKKNERNCWKKMASGMFVASFRMKKMRNERWAKMSVQGLKKPSCFDSRSREMCKELLDDVSHRVINLWGTCWVISRPRHKFFFIFSENLILVQIECWRRGWGMQVARYRGNSI